MTYVIAQPCVDLKDRACVEECPVDCIYEGKRMLYIHPDECVDCGACEPVCPVEAIYYEDDTPEEWADYYKANVEFFDDLGSPDGATVAVPTDLANQGQALWLLEREGLIGLDPDIEPRTAQLKDVVENPRRFDFTEIDLLSMARTLDSVDAALGYTNIFDADKIGRDKGILFPDPPRTYASWLIVGTEFKDTPETRKLVEVFSDPRFEEYLETTDNPLVAGVLTPVSEQ